MDALQRRQKPGSRGVRADRIDGSYRAITVHQLALAWWLFNEGHITKPAFKIYFALHEMAERRRYAQDDREFSYELKEIIRLVGGRGEESKARSEIRKHLAQLREIGLADFSTTSITFASSADAIRVDDLSGFFSFIEKISDRNAIPVPRRMIRALASGLRKNKTALVLAMLIRGLWWHKATDDYRVDGRVKLSWVAEVFGVSRRQLSEALTHLVDWKWVQVLDPVQWQKNQWGTHFIINVAWEMPRAVGEQDNASAKTASPNADFSAKTASPDLTDSLSLKGESKHQKTRPKRSGSAGVSLRSTLGSRKKSNPGQPNIRDIQPDDFRSTDRMLELHRQACSMGLSSNSEHGRMTFLALAERARCRANKPGAMLFWLLREKKSAFITQHDEDEAARRLREHFNGPQIRRPVFEGRAPAPQPPEYSDDEKAVMACLRASKTAGVDPYLAARKLKGWTRDEWEAAHLAFHQTQLERMRPDQQQGA